MSRLLEWFEVTPFVQKVSLVGLFLAISGVGFYWLIAEPLVVEIDTLVGELRILDHTLKLETQSENQLGTVQKEFLQWQSIVSRQEERLGLDVPMSQVLSDMSSIAQETGIILTLWKPKKRDIESSSQVHATYLQLQVEGGYHHVAQFLEHMQYLSKTMGVTALTMHGDDTDDGIPMVRAIIDLMGYSRNVQTLADNNHMSVIDERITNKG
ncbi:MAG: type 4a pilus biogenesis protein PilO [Nitrospirales bacterium]